MKILLLSLFLSTLSMASLQSIYSFKADFVQSVIDDKQKTLTYNGHVVASKPQNALWKYTKPVTKDVYINSNTVTVIEPEIEQVIIKRIQSSFDFFKLIKNAKEVEKNKYVTSYQNSEFTITTERSLIKDISYMDEFENKVKIVFTHQKQNEDIEDEVFIPLIPLEFDIIRE